MKPEYTLSAQGSLFGHRDVVGFGTNALQVKEIDRNQANVLIKANHYSHVYYAGSYIHLGVFAGSTLMGVLQYGVAMNPASQESVVGNTGPKEYLELNRMWLNDAMPRNSESQAISYSLKFIKRKYPRIKWIQSFADERCGRYGVVYQACSFLYCGEHTSVFWELDGEMYHNSLMTRNPDLTPKAALIQKNKDRAKPHKLRQFRYIFFLKKQHRKYLKLPVLPYPKHPAETVGAAE